MKTQIDLGGTFTLPGTSMILNRMGYGAMQLAGPQVWGPPRDREAAVAVLREAVAAGVKIAFSTDVPVCPYKDAGKEFAYMVKYGMTPMQAIQAATIGGAELIGVLDKVGSIKKGKLADMIAVQGDPTQNVRLLEDVKFVMKDGKVYKSSDAAIPVTN